MIEVLVLAGIGIYAYAKGGGVNGRLYGLKDCKPEEQGGNYKRDFDSSYERAANKTGVPFALLKAHAIRESSQKPQAFVNESAGRADRAGWASRGLMQILWWPGSDRFAKYGYPDSSLGDGSIMFQPDINCEIAAKLIADNLKACDGNLRDTINMYNTGVKESKRVAPFNYVDDVLEYYEEIANL